MRVLSVCSYPNEAAATRFRVGQFAEPLRKRGIEIDVRPFLDSKQFEQFYRSGEFAGKVAGVAGSVLRRLSDVLRSPKYDLLLVQREAMFFGPEIFERLALWFGIIPLVLDLDDATYIPYKSPTYGGIGSALKFFGKTDRLIKRSAVVICGNRFIAEYVESQGTRAVVIPTVVDTSIFAPREKKHDVPTLGWIGTHSTFPSIESIYPALERLATKHRFTLRLVGTGRSAISIPGVEVDNLPWSLEREPADFACLDIGLYPIVASASASDEWLKGKSGFKAIQYLAVGVPFVMSPVGVGAEIGINEETHFNAESNDDWYNALDSLLSDPQMRTRMGGSARKHSLENYTIDKWSAVLADVLFSAIDGAGRR